MYMCCTRTHIYMYVETAVETAIETSGLTRLLLVKAHMGWRWGSRQTQYVLMIGKN